MNADLRHAISLNKASWQSFQLHEELSLFSSVTHNELPVSMNKTANTSI